MRCVLFLTSARLFASARVKLQFITLREIPGFTRYTLERFGSTQGSNKKLWIPGSRIVASGCSRTGWQTCPRKSQRSNEAPRLAVCRCWAFIQSFVLEESEVAAYKERLGIEPFCIDRVQPRCFAPDNKKVTIIQDYVKRRGPPGWIPCGRGFRVA